MQQALSIISTHGRDKEPLAGTVLCDLGMAWLGTGEYAAARRCLDQSLAIRRELPGDHRIDTSHSLHNLGFVLEDTGDFPRALECYAQALAIRRTLCGPTDPRTLKTMVSIAVLLKSMGRYEEARPYYEEVLELERHVHGNEHTETFAALANWGAFQYVIGELISARSCLQEAMRIGGVLWPVGDPRLGSTRHTLALSLTDLGEYRLGAAWLRGCAGNGSDEARNALARSHRCSARHGKAL